MYLEVDSMDSERLAGYVNCPLPSTSRLYIHCTSYGNQLMYAVFVRLTYSHKGLESAVIVERLSVRHYLWRLIVS